MKISTLATTITILSALALVPACKSSDSAGGGGSETQSGDGDGDGAGDGDGDGSGDGDGDGAGDGDGDGDGSGDGDGDGDGTGDGDGDGDGDGEPPPCEITECNGKLYECGDCEDNDDDGDIDGQDLECISPCDDDEGSFASGLPGDNADPCLQDCFFDGNSGAGDDGCVWNLKCDPESPGAPECPYDADFQNCPDTQDDECMEACNVPNGCDCFGCCQVEFEGETHYIFLGAPDCSFDNFDACPECTINEDCEDPCEPELCELCFGMTEDDLPDDCDEQGCDEGLVACEDNVDCPESFYCQTGCCVPIPQ